MAILNRKEEKMQAVLGRLPEKYTHEQFVEQFIKAFSKDWGKIKSAYIKQSQDKEAGTVINMPRPELYLKQLHDLYLAKRTVPIEVVKRSAAVSRAKAAKQVVKDQTVAADQALSPEATVVVAKASADATLPAKAVTKVKKPAAVKQLDAKPVAKAKKLKDSSDSAVGEVSAPAKKKPAARSVKEK